MKCLVEEVLLKCGSSLVPCLCRWSRREFQQVTQHTFYGGSAAAAEVDCVPGVHT